MKNLSETWTSIGESAKIISVPKMTLKRLPATWGKTHGHKHFLLQGIPESQSFLISALISSQQQVCISR